MTDARHPGFRRARLRIAARTRGRAVCCRPSALILAAAGACCVLAAAGNLRGEPKYAGDCTSSGCHGPLVERKFVHAPAADACDACHEVADEARHKFSLTESGASLCFDCHDRFEGKHTHAPVADDGDCTTCHAPHGSETRGLLVAASTGEQCAACHEDVTEGLAFLHGPVAAGDCTICHNPHVSQHAALLRAEEPALCVDCHDDVQQRLAGAAYVHEPAKNTCTLCHKPHGAANKLMLSNVAPALCADCHDDVMTTVSKATHPHAPVTENAACATCHDPHASPFSAMLVKTQAAVCLGCHDKPIERDGQRVAGIGDKLGEGSNVHEPVKDGDCSLCHAVHGGERSFLLAAAFPERFYAGFSEDRYALCFDCHDAGAFTETETDDLTGFRNGTHNLHAVHVNKPVKGRTCVACHDPHGSRQTKLIANLTPFGEWQIPIRFTPTETGGTCSTGCHRPYRYDRNEAVVNVPSELAPATP